MKISVVKWNEKEGNTLTDDKLIRINDNKPEYGSMMVVSEAREFALGGFTNKKTRVAFITGLVEDLEGMIEEHKLKDGSNFNQVFGEHKIVVVEKLASEVGERDGFSEKINPTTGEVLYKGGEVIMRRTYLVGAASELADTMIEHDRVPATDEAIAEFQGEAANAKSK